MRLFSTHYRSSLRATAFMLVLALSACQPITRPTDGNAPAQNATANLEQIPGVAAVRQSLAHDLKVEVAAITINSVEKVEWPDACLGAAKPEEMCAAVITPGVKVIFKAANNQYEYHISADGTQQRLAPTQ